MNFFKPIALIAGLALAGGAVAQSQPEKKTLTLADSKSYTQQPIRFGVEKGFFAEEGLDVEFTDVSDIPTGVATGELTFAFGPTSVYLRAAALGAPIKIVSSAFRSKGPFFLLAGKNVKSFADLKGKTVGNAIAGSNMDAYLRVILRENGVDPDKDVTLFAAGTNQQAYGALISGQVDATIIHQPFPALAELEGEGKTLARGWDYLPTYHTGVLIAGNDVLAKDPDLVERGLRAYFRSYTYAKAHYDEYIPWLQKQLHLNPEAVANAIRQEDDIWDNNPAIDRKAIADTQAVEIALGNQDAPYDAEKFIDERFIPKDYVKPFSYPTRPAGSSN
ncbi:ABC transporter substrate-binding protein [Rhizobium puerariae]|uniref:ABC transporter substrate-binding protein n=1 Tax=Rhizobium puerariae TaxID=1585791 RepID=A0ABV6AP89_9HYPH